MGSLRQMEYWLAVVEEGSFTRAAHRMHVSQPSLSQQVRALERELGGPLLDRLPRSVRLTPAGKAFLPHARVAVRAAERAERSARSALALESGELEISTVRSIAVGLLPGLIHSWHTRHPDTVVRLHEFTHRALVEQAVRDGLSDLGVGPPPADWPGPVRRLGWEEFVVVLPVDDPLAAAGRLELAALAERNWVMFEPGNGLCDLILTACAAAGFSPDRAVETSQVETAARLAAAGVGPTLVPANTLPEGLAAAVVPLDPPLGRELTAYSRMTWGSLGQAFLELLEATDFGQVPPGAFVVG